MAPTAQWITTLPVDVQPLAIAKTFPHIANGLAEHWKNPHALKNYVNELLVDQEERRRRLPIKFSRELHALRAYHASLHRERDIREERDGGDCVELAIRRLLARSN